MTTIQTWDELDARPIPTWFQDARFGIFIHWGPYSVPAWRSTNNELFGSYAEWYYASVYGPYRNNDGDYHARTWGTEFRYRDFAPLLSAEHFDPQEWAALFQQAGARYVVLTSKHHDGYCMWATDNPHKKNWNCADVGAHRDLLGELTTAVRDAGLRMGLYYSMPEWETHRSHRVNGGYFIPEDDAQRFGMPPERYVDDILHPQWKELNEKYAPSVIYTDGGEWDLDEDYVRTRELLTWLYTQAPNRNEVVVNDRMHVGMPGHHGDYYSTEYADVEGYGEDHPWEESRGIGKSYGYNRAETPDSYLTASQLIDLLIQTVGKGGNFLLNVGPTADGRIPDIQRERLEEIGRWMAVNGSAIYQTRPLSISLPDGVYAVRSHNPSDEADTVYLLCTSQAPSRITLPWPIASAYVMGGKEALPYDGSSIDRGVTTPMPCTVRCTGVERN